LKFFKQGNVVEYNGGRTADTIISWITKRMGEQSTEVTKKSEIEELVTKSVVVAYFGEKNDQFTEFLGLAEQMEEVLFIHSFDPKLKTEMKASIVTIFKSFDDLQNNFDGEFDIEKVADFVTVNSLKTIMDFD
jgi:protein disulfide-isomerase A1